MKLPVNLLPRERTIRGSSTSERDTGPLLLLPDEIDEGVHLLRHQTEKEKSVERRACRLLGGEKIPSRITKTRIKERRTTTSLLQENRNGVEAHLLHLFVRKTEKNRKDVTIAPPRMRRRSKRTEGRRLLRPRTVDKTGGRNEARKGRALRVPRPS